MRVLATILGVTLLAGCAVEVDGSAASAQTASTGSAGGATAAPGPSTGAAAGPDAAAGPSTTGTGPALGDTGPGAQRDGCGVSVEAEPQVVPTDVIWAIDTSGSMLGSFPAIQEALNRFSTQVDEAGIDAHIVLVAGAGLCVPPPLGSGECGGGDLGGGPGGGSAGVAPDSLEPRFLHLDVGFGFNEGMAVLLDNYPAYAHMLRPGAQTHVVLTEDGNSPVASQAVIDHVEGRAPATCAGLGQCPSTAAWDPGLAPGSWSFHGVLCTNTVAGGQTDLLDALGGLAGGGLCLLAVPPNNTLDVITATGGLTSDLGLAGGGGDPFAELLQALAEKVVVNAVSCDYTLPDPAETGEPLDPSKVNVFYTASDGSVNQFGKASSEQSCADGLGWYFDDEQAPTQVLLCPAACELVQSDANLRLDVEFGCDSVQLI